MLNKNFQEIDDMEVFYKTLLEHPIEIYLQMVIAHLKEGENFSFPPFKSTLLYLKKSQEMNALYKEKHERLSNNGFPFYETNLFIQSVMENYNLYESFHSNNKKELTTSKVLFIGYIGQTIFFKFACHAALDLPFFIYLRGFPVFPLGVTVENIRYDYYLGKLDEFYMHDDLHAKFTLALDKMIMEALKIDVYPIIDRYLFSIYLQTIIESIADVSLKGAVEILMLDFFRENETHAFSTKSFDQKSPHNFWEHYDVFFNVKKTVDDLIQRIKRGYAYSDKHKISEVLPRIFEAAILVESCFRAYDPPQLTPELRLMFTKPDENYTMLCTLINEMKQQEISKGKASSPLTKIVPLFSSRQLLTHDFAGDKIPWNILDPLTNYKILDLYVTELASYAHIIIETHQKSSYIKENFYKLLYDFYNFLTAPTNILYRFNPNEYAKTQECIMSFVTKKMKELFATEVQENVLMNLIERGYENFPKECDKPNLRSEPTVSN